MRPHDSAPLIPVARVVRSEQDELYDVIVVGAGPGGSSAAAVALRRGLSVAQIDRSTFPRVKPCGGGVTIKTTRALPFDLAPMVRGESKVIELNVWERRRNRFAKQSATLLRMVARPEFDNWLVGENRKQARFRFFDGERVTHVEYDGVFSVRTANRTLRGKQLVGADGAYSIVNRLFKITEPKGFAVAVEIALPRAHASLAADVPASFDFGAIARGYGWVFPKDDHWNIGLYTVGRSPTIRQDLLRYIEQKGFRPTRDPLESFQAHQFPYGGHRVTVPDAPVYLVGDAGGFGDPIMGEGIYHAVESGRIAGDAIADSLAGRATYHTYYERLRPTVLRDTAVTYHISREFYRNVDKAMTILENPVIWRAFMQGYADGASFSRSLARAWWFAPKSLALRQIEYCREGSSLSLALPGPLRGLAYLGEPFLKRVQRRVFGAR